MAVVIYLPRLIELVQELDAAQTGFQQTPGEFAIEDSVTSLPPWAHGWAYPQGG